MFSEVDAIICKRKSEKVWWRGKGKVRIRQNSKIERNRLQRCAEKKKNHNKEREMHRRREGGRCKCERGRRVESSRSWR